MRVNTTSISKQSFILLLNNCEDMEIEIQVSAGSLTDYRVCFLEKKLNLVSDLQKKNYSIRNHHWQCYLARD